MKTASPLDFTAVTKGSVTAPSSQDGVATKLDMKPKTVQCAIKGVYASLWNARAIEERSFARLDHATAAEEIRIGPEIARPAVPQDELVVA